MLLWLADYLAQYFTAFGVVKYLTFRAILGVLTSLGISLLFGPAMIRRLNYLQIGQSIRTDGPQSHLSKSGTPTMGGALILISIFVSTLLWSDLSNHYVWVVLAVTTIFGAVGWVDDYRKVVEKIPEGCLQNGNICGNQWLVWVPRSFFIKAVAPELKMS